MLFVGIVVLQNSAKVLMLSILFMFMHGYVQSGAQIDIKSINLRYGMTIFTLVPYPS